ncbi:lanosterol synthase [Apiospora phragmitis]|uniref:Lanosterol synthase n=1 Tax=Apiospora phragmitis TaxID=2905665 RepID=A0ABR1T968_9PEZI
MTRYLAHHANEDGGWGLHLEGKSTVFATGLYYVMLRLLGHDKDHPLLAPARACLLSHGGAAGIQQWGKIWLACLNLYGWEGVHCIPTDLWALPEWLPFHPWRWWVQCRAVYLPTSYLWSNRCTVPLTPLLQEIRDEIYTAPYRAVDFRRARSHTAPSDALRTISPLLLCCFALLRVWFDFLRLRWLHRLADRRVSRLMRSEEHNTGYHCLAPVNKAFHMAAAHFADGPGSERVRRHRETVDVYLWLGPRGMTCGGTKGVQVWDTAFIVQAAAEAGLAADPRFRAPLLRALGFLDKS